MRKIIMLIVIAMVTLTVLIARPAIIHEAARPASYAQEPARMLIIIDADRQRLTLYENGAEVKRYGVAVGTRDTPSMQDGSNFWATMHFMLNAKALRIALCIDEGKRSRIRPIVLGAEEA